MKNAPASALRQVRVMESELRNAGHRGSDGQLACSPLPHAGLDQSLVRDDVSGRYRRRAEDWRGEPLTFALGAGASDRSSPAHRIDCERVRYVRDRAAASAGASHLRGAGCRIRAVTLTTIVLRSSSRTTIVRANGMRSIQMRPVSGAVPNRRCPTLV